ncbi:hypothetical protein PV10_06417 [Exophiala mesophila]|uniref:Uncharacterized protein n=1 Tax=Exophiala mesophila TaxID=212818 RepID=A0A0D1XUP3_EXOME|nr:uncharacterized protein PV10_06417 [Exophiala mesophila]KIV91931.1 hypothetical protein PV10_06417 [Exophiala mesophila]
MEYPFPKPPRDLTGKVAIITGAGAHGDGIGNGRAAAILLAEDGCHVVCVDLDEKLAQRTVEMITSDPGDTFSTQTLRGQAIAISGDVSNESDCARIVQTTLDRFGRVDILFNSVGIGGAKGTAIDVDMVEWAKGMEINVASMVMMAKYAIPAMKQNDLDQALADGWGCRGSIVNMGSVAGIRGGTPTLLYPTSKGAVVNLTRAMATHHAPDGIRVNCICPGMVYTPMMYAGGKMSDAGRESRKNRSLLKTEGNGWDVGMSVRFLAGPQARWITGTILTVDAGVTAAVGTDLPRDATVAAK